MENCFALRDMQELSHGAETLQEKLAEFIARRNATCEEYPACVFASPCVPPRELETNKRLVGGVWDGRKVDGFIGRKRTVETIELLVLAERNRWELGIGMSERSAYTGNHKGMLRPKETTFFRV